MVFIYFRVVYDIDYNIVLILYNFILIGSLKASEI